ncbi:MAG: NUDIX domain-containing protein [Planctomycetes bacterium]|nr:NUDIX domain-containing protein [Planctomycetota bacterium]
MLGFAAEHVDPFDRRLEVGHFTGAAFVIDGRGRLLLTHHRKLGLWLQLGGHAESERRGEAVALREAHEESGLARLEFHPALRDERGAPRLLDLDIHAIPARRDEPAHEHWDLRYLLLAEEPEKIVLDPAESRALAWVAYEEAERRCDGGILRALAKIRALARA